LNQYSGLQPQNVLLMRTQLSRSKYGEEPKRNAFYTQVLDRVKNLPGVVSAGYTTSAPLDWKGGTRGFWIEGRTVEQAVSQGLSSGSKYRLTSAGYRKVIGMRLR